MNEITEHIQSIPHLPEMELTQPFIITGLTVFILACFVGYHVIWRVTPALHSPLMGITNAISSVIIVGAVIAAGAVVSKDVAPYTIVGGVAAKPIKRRFSEAVAERLLSLAWWDWQHDQLRHALHDFRKLNVEAFLEKYEHQ